MGIMLRIGIVAVFLAGGSLSAWAQSPGASPPPQPATPGYGQPGYGQPGYGYQQPYQPYAAPLTAKEMRILERGEITPGRHILGGVVSLYPGFGLGHAIQGRYMDKGWIFTAGELASLGVLVVGLTGCIENTNNGYETDCRLAVAGGLAFVGFRLWEIGDSWFGPGAHNERVRELRMRTGYYRPRYSWYIAPTSSSSGVAGLSLRF